MFRTAELGRKVDKEQYETVAPALRIELLELQQRLRTADFPTIIVMAGVDGAGKNQTINLMNEWLDPRWVVTRAYSAPSDEERERPEFWRYWRDLPARGQVGLFLRSWYSAPVLDFAFDRTSDGELHRRLDRILAFESDLTADGALIVKFWLHLSQDAQKRQLTKLSKNPEESWRVSEADWKHWKMYDRFIAAAERTITRTSTADAPWSIIEGENRRYRELAVMTALRDAIVRHLERRSPCSAPPKPAPSVPEAIAPESAPAPTPASIPPGGSSVIRRTQPSILDTLDMAAVQPKEEADQKIRHLTATLSRLQRQARENGVSSVLVFEGWDAAGKGGSIRRVTAAVDARDYQVFPISAPTDEERAHHYLWRFWRHLSRAGRIIIFDRSWYGRVLVERVENYARQDEWRRAYTEINDFEQQLTDHGIVLVKYWMHITPEEQLARFLRRETIPWKSWKLTAEDWRNRDKWALYEDAVNDMIERTSTSTAPWTLVPANDKPSARVKVLETFCSRLRKTL